VRDSDDDTHDLLKWKIGGGGHVSMADLKNPATADPTILLCLYDASGFPQPLLEGTILAGGSCGGRPCWKTLGGAGGYRYKNPSATPDGLTDLKLKIAGQGELQLVLKGKGADLSLPALGFTTPVTLALVLDDAVGTSCWQATFTTALRNDAALFKATTP
jgi:hypothetical protein